MAWWRLTGRARVSHRAQMPFPERVNSWRVTRQHHRVQAFLWNLVEAKSPLFELPPAPKLFDFLDVSSIDNLETSALPLTFFGED